MGIAVVTRSIGVNLCPCAMHIDPATMCQKWDGTRKRLKSAPARGAGAKQVAEAAIGSHQIMSSCPSLVAAHACSSRRKRHSGLILTSFPSHTVDMQQSNWISSIPIPRMSLSHASSSNSVYISSFPSSFNVTGTASAAILTSHHSLMI